MSLNSLVPEQEFENPNDFYTKEESERYENSSGMKNTQILLTKIALELSGFEKEQFSSLKVLDIGCGTGFSLEYLKSIGFKNLKGIDPSKEMIKISKSKGFNVQLLGFEDLKKLNGNFDLIISISALQWVTSNKQGLELKNIIKKIGKQINLLLDKNGVFVVQFYESSEESLENIISAFERCSLTVGKYYYNEKSIKKRKLFLKLTKI